MMMDLVLRERQSTEEMMWTEENRREMKREEKEEGEKGEKKYPDTFEDTDDENPPDEEGGGGGGGGGERGGLENFGTNERIRKIVNEREIERQEGDEEVGRERGRGRGIGLRHRCFMSQCRERIRGGSHREERERGGGGGGGGGGMREEEERERVEREHRRIQSESGVEPVRQKQRITRTTNQETPSKHPNETDFTHATHTTLHPLPLPQSYPHPHQHPYHHATPYQYPLLYPQCTYNPPNTLPITGKRKHYTSLTKDYITGLAFLARVDRVARVMVGRSMSIMEVRQCSSPALRLLVPQSEGVAAEGEDKCLQDLHSLQQTISQCSSGGKGIVTPELRIYCRSLLLAVLCPGRHQPRFILVENGVKELEGRAFLDHGASQVKYCWSVASSLCIILERVGWVPSAQ